MLRLFLLVVCLLLISSCSGAEPAERNNQNAEKVRRYYDDYDDYWNRDYRDGWDDDDYRDSRDRWDNRWDRYGKFNCPKSNGVFPDPEDCSYYYVCYRGYGNRRRCRNHELFDTIKNKCRSKYVAVCYKGKTTTTTPKGTDVTVEEDKFSCPTGFGTHMHPKDCSKYYVCMIFIPTLKTCPKDELFDGVKLKCKNAKKVHCGSRLKPGETTPVAETVTPTPTPVKTPRPETPSPSPTPARTPRPQTSSPSPRPQTASPSPRPQTASPSPRPQTASPSPRPQTASPSPRPQTASPSPRPQTASPSPRPETPSPTPVKTPRPTPSPTPIKTERPTTRPPTPTARETTTPVEITTPKPTPPEINCEEDDLDCIIDGTGEKPKWFKCPEDIGSYPHPSSKRLFIFCFNRKPSVKKCGQNLVYSENLRTCITA